MSLIENYHISQCELGISLVTLTGAAYACRHFQKAVNLDKHWFGHGVLFIVDCIPGLGILALAIERIIYNCLAKPKESSAMLTQRLDGQSTAQILPSGQGSKQLPSYDPEDPNQAYQIFVKHIDGKTYTCDVTRKTTLQAIKEELEQRSGRTVPSYDCFLYAGSRYGPEHTIEQVGLDKEGTLHIALRLGPALPPA